MKFSSVARAAGVSALLAALALPAVADPKVIKVPPAAAPLEIAAAYRISLNGFNLGSLQFNARIQNGTYVADSDVSLSALLGAFRWYGVTRTAGTLSGGVHRPQAYSFDFDGSVKSGSVRMGFTGAEITSVSVKPDSFSAPDTVPLERQHLKSTLDPLSAVMALIRVEGEAPCGRKLAIFDGKQRFDLALVARREAAGTPGIEPVCRIKYTPVAGYRPNAETKAMAESNGIEIAFRRVANAGLMVPHRVVIPTMAGDAVIEAERVSIDAGGRGLVAQAE
jgi:hypothetical protein